jgi:signal peptidase II
MKGKNMLIGIILIVLGIGLDQISKVIAHTYFRNEIKVIDNFFSLVYVENTGAAWGMMKGRLWLLIIVALVALGIFAYLMKDFNLQTKPVYSISLILMVTGAIGNLIDRIFRGFVIDFLEFTFGNYHFPVFNLADSFLTIGVILLIIDVLFGKSSELLK